MAAIGKVAAVFTAQTSGLTSGVQAASSAFRNLGNASGQLSGGLGGVTSRLNALIALDVARIFGSLANAAAGAVGSLVRLGAAQAETVDQTSKLAARLGMTYVDLAGLALAGELAGVGLDQIGAAATRADIAFVRASQGSQSATQAFAGLGLTVQQLAGLNAADRFDAIASAIAALPTEAQRAAAAVQIFGRAGTELLPLFNGGADAIRQAREEADAFGLSLTTAQGQDIEGMNDAFTRAQQAIAGVVQQVTAFLAPAIQAVVDTFANFIASVGGANIGQSIGEGILTGAEYLAGVGDFLIANLSSVWQYVAAVAGNWNGTISVLAQVGAGLRAVFDAAAVAFLTVFRVAITPLSNIIEQLAGLASYLPGVAGEVAGQIAASTQGFREGIDAQIASYSQSFVNNVGQAIDGPAQQAGQQLAGPLVTTFRQAREAAQASAAAVDEVKNAPVEVQQQVEVTGIAQALKAVDSRSKDGVAEMFRIMRGDTGNVQEQQLSVLEQIAENTSGIEELPAMDLAGA